MTGRGRTRALAAVTATPRAALLPLLASAGAILAVVGALWLGAARSLVHHCLTVDGPLALLGVRLVLLQDAADCPTGTLALTPAASHGAVLALGLVVPVVAANAALGVLGLGLTAVLLRAARTVRAVLGGAVHVLPQPRSLRPVPARAVPRWRVDLVRHADLVRALHPHRGPPVALA